MSLLKRIEQSNRSRVTTIPSKGARRIIRPPKVAFKADRFTELKNRVQERLISEMDFTRVEFDEAEARRKVEEYLDAILAEDNIFISRIEKQRLLEQILDEILGYGPIQPLLEDDTINEIMVNGPKNIYIERNGKIEKTNISFQDEEHLMRVIDRILAPLGRRVVRAPLMWMPACPMAPV